MIRFEDLVPQLTLVAFGSVLTLVVQFLTHRWTSQAAKENAQVQRQFEVSKDAYKQAIQAIDEVREVPVRDVPIESREAYEVMGRCANAIRDARIALGMPLVRETEIAIVDAYFGVLVAAHDKHEPDEKLEKGFLELINAEQKAITSAWQKLLTGKN